MGRTMLHTAGAEPAGLACASISSARSQGRLISSGVLAGVYFQTPL